MREEYGASKSYPAILRKKFTFKLKDYIKEKVKFIYYSDQNDINFT